MPPTDIEKYTKAWLRFIRRVSIPTTEQLDAMINEGLLYPPMVIPTNRFAPDRIFNFDETPLPYNTADGTTYYLKGEKSINSKVQRSGWDKKQVTFIPYLRADSQDPGLRSKVICKSEAQEDGGKLHQKEGRYYNRSINVHFNSTAYNTGDLTVKWAKEEFISTVKPTLAQPVLLAMDCASFHKSPEFLSYLRENHVTVAMIPPGLTSYLQPCDTAFNKPFKFVLSMKTEDYEALKEQDPKFKKWTVAQKRIQMTHNIADTMADFYNKKSALIAKSFVDVGLNLPTDGSKDHLLSIKDFGHGLPQIGDFTILDHDIEAWQKTHERIPEIGDDGEYIMVDGLPLIDYNVLTVEHLREAMRRRMVAGVGGNKASLVAALKADDLYRAIGQDTIQFEGYIHDDSGPNWAALGQRKRQYTLQIKGYIHELWSPDEALNLDDDDDDEDIEIQMEDVV